MNALNADSLIATLEKVNETLVDGGIPSFQRTRVANWLVGRIGQCGSYRGLFPAPTAEDFARGGRLYTGEAIRSRAEIACKIGVEAVRALVLLDSREEAVAMATRQAVRGALSLMDWNIQGHHRSPGMYCCCSCSVSFWRLLAVVNTARARRFLTLGLEALRNRRDGQGRWRSFPFWYTVLSLSEMQGCGARSELQYAAGRLERLLRRQPAEGIFARRRIELARKVLAIA